MSKLIVEICEVKEVKEHPNADRMAIAVVKGWNICIQKNPDTGETQFQPGEKCIYIPYDAVLPPELANGPEDDPAGRLNVAKYCAPIKSGHVPGCFRVRAARLRGQRSFGIIVKIEPELGDDPDWEVGTDVAEHFGITKWNPPETCEDGDAERPHPRLHTYVEIERFQNFPTAIPEGEEVVFTEKIHGKNNRIGMVLDKDDDGNAEWIWVAGSHEVRRKPSSPIMERFDAVPLVEKLCLPNTDVEIGQRFKDLGGRFWEVIETRPIVDERVLFKATRVLEDGSPVEKKSDFWMFLTDELRAMIEYIRDEHEWHEPKAGIVVFGEFFGSGVQSMAYGRSGKDFMVFDIAVNGTYLDWDVKEALCGNFGVPMVPVLYKGPFSVAEMEKHTDGPTTMCPVEQAGKFKGREGIVITPRKERWSDETGDRTILKSVSVDYLASNQSDNR